MNITMNRLRDLVPTRAMRMDEALQISEAQANRLLKASGIRGPAVPESVITSLPLVQVARVKLLSEQSAAHYSESRWWLILLDESASSAEQRFNLARQLKYVLDHPFRTYAYPRTRTMTSDERAEQAASYFASCLLMPRRWLHKAWAAGGRDVAQLAQDFDVPYRAMQLRLLEVGLIKATDCSLAKGA